MARNPVFIGIGGGTASGKTSLCRRLQEELGVNCALLEMDNFYSPLTQEQLANVADYNFDHPNSIDFNEIQLAVDNLLKGDDALIPIYDFTLHQRKGQRRFITSAPLVVYEGIYALYDDHLCDQMVLRVFVQTDDDIRLCRRIKRDMQERGRDLDGVLN